MKESHRTRVHTPSRTASTAVNKALRGASRSLRESDDSNNGRVLGWLSHACLLAVVLIAGYVISQWLMQQMDRPVTNVSINGEFTRVSREEAADKVYAAMGNSFMKLNLVEIQAQLTAMPWVDRVQVARRWPDQLVVSLVEHRPIAQWGERDALNHRGEVIELEEGAASRTLLKGLPQLRGVAGMEQEMMLQYQALNKLLMEQNLSVLRLTCDESRSWAVTLSDGVELNLGRDQIMEKVGRFKTVYEKQLRSRWAELSRIDLRYYNGLAVEWRQG